MKCFHKHVSPLQRKNDDAFSKKVKVLRYKPDVALGVPGG